MHKVHLIIENEKSNIIHSILKVEKVPRAELKTWKEDDTLHVVIEATTAANLRAACNSFLKWIDLADKIGNMVLENK
jgi:tRNA threonylcarbamoyladenosine modification (KEOPS) complex  Pcc1 subunit